MVKKKKRVARYPELTRGGSSCSPLRSGAAGTAARCLAELEAGSASFAPCLRAAAAAGAHLTHAGWEGRPEWRAIHDGLRPAQCDLPETWRAVPGLAASRFSRLFNPISRHRVAAGPRAARAGAAAFAVWAARCRMARHRPQRGRHHNTARPHAHRFAAATAPAVARRTRQMRGPWTRLRRRCRCLRRSLCCLPAYRSARPASQAVRACVDKGRSRSNWTRGPGRSATVARSDARPGCRSGRSPAPRLRRIWCHAARRSAVLRRDAGLAACP